jgi:Fungal trichothecene efflux pump (TRI12)
VRHCFNLQISPSLGNANYEIAQWCFYINLPFGGVTAAFIIFFFKAPKRVRARATGWRAQLDQFDILGTSLLVPAVVCLLLALQWGGSKYPWSNGRVVALFVVFGLSMASFVAIQIWKKDNATVPPRIFKNRNVWGTALFSAALGASFFGIIYFVRLRLTFPITPLFLLLLC